MLMVCHVQHICRTACYHLRNIASIRSYLAEKAAVQIIHSLVIARLDYANTLLFDSPDFLITKLQRVQNPAVRLVVRCSRWEHITPVQMKQECLDVKECNYITRLDGNQTIADARLTKAVCTTVSGDAHCHRIAENLYGTSIFIRISFTCWCSLSSRFCWCRQNRTRSRQQCMYRCTSTF